MVMDWLSPVLDIATRLSDCIFMHTFYIRCLNYMLPQLEVNRDRLIRQANDIRDKVEAAERDPRTRRTREVENWLTSAETMLNELGGILAQGHRQSQNTCLGGRCPKNLLSTYKIGKKIVDKLQHSSCLNSTGERFYQDSALVVRLPLTPFLMPEFVVENVVGLDLHVERVWRYIDDERIRVIRLCGVGGVGKSTLLKKVCNEFRNQNHDFNVVIWAKVSTRGDHVMKLQEAIRRKLDMSDDLWNQCSSEEEKGARISSVLKNKKFVFLLDDVREWFDLSRLGIHLQIADPNNLSKVIYATRSVDLHNAMEAQETIELKFLPPDQASRLFRMTIGEDFLNSNPEFSKLAEIIATRCGGLPLALLTVGRAMACRRNPREWLHAVELIHTNPSEIEGVGTHVFPLLRFSYDSLNNATTQSCFLYCSIFPKDYNIRIDELIDLWIGEGFLDASNPRYQAEFIVGTLKLAYLLESDESKQYVRMHDIVHDMALWLARDQGTRKNKVLVTQGGAIENQDLTSWDEANWISLWGAGRVNANYSLTCNNLSTLIFRDIQLKSFPSGFFDSMPALKVLDLSGNQASSEFPLDIGNVETLQYLNLSLTSIVKLPASLTKLRMLRCLLLDYTTNLKKIPKELISSLLLLHVYSKIHGVLEYFDLREVAADDEMAFLKALECLNHINKVCITISAAPSVGKIMNSYTLSSCIRKLTLMKCDGLISLCITQELGNLERLEIHGCCSLEEVKLSDLGKLGNLRQVYIGVCPHLLNLNFLAYAKNLESLTILDCKFLWEISDEIIAFPALKTISLTHLKYMRSICPPPICIPSLSEIEVSQCPLLRQLPFDLETRKYVHKIRGETDWWNDLIWDDEDVKLACASKFVSTSPGHSQKKKYEASTSRSNI